MDQILKSGRDNFCTILQAIFLLMHWGKTRRNSFECWAIWPRIEFWNFRQSRMRCNCPRLMYSTPTFLCTVHFDFCGPYYPFYRKATYCYCKTNWANYRRIC